MSVLVRLLSALLALALFFVATVAAVEIALAAAHRHSWLARWTVWRAWALHHSWHAPPVEIAAGCACVVGLTLVVVAVAPRRPRTLTSTAGTTEFAIEVHRPTLERALTRDVARLDGIASSSVRVSRRRVRIRAQGLSHDVIGRRDAIETATSARLADLGLGDHAIRVAVAPRRN